MYQATLYSGGGINEPVTPSSGVASGRNQWQHLNEPGALHQSQVDVAVRDSGALF